nr:MAG TPA: hypothetical protein [Microviridae sp.]
MLTVLSDTKGYFACHSRSCINSLKNNSFPKILKSNKLVKINK